MNYLRLINKYTFNRYSAAKRDNFVFDLLVISNRPQISIEHQKSYP